MTIFWNPEDKRWCEECDEFLQQYHSLALLEDGQVIPDEKFRPGYEKQTGLKGHEQVIGGGTFGRLLERGVAYGAMFPDSIDTMHQANEFIALDDLFRAAAIYAEAIYELIK